MSDVETRLLETDRALLDAFRRGERDALGEVFERYVDDVTRTIRAGVVVEIDGKRTRVGKDLDEPTVEALVQDTFVRAFSPNARTAYDGLRPYGAYLATIARNLLIDEGRRRARGRKFEARAVDVERLADDGDGAPDVVHEQSELTGIVDRFADALDEPDRSIFRLRYREEQSHRATATALSLSEIQVRRRDTKLRAALLSLLRASGYLTKANVAIGSSLLGRRGVSETEG